MRNKYFVYSGADEKIFGFSNKKKANIKFKELLEDNFVMFLTREKLKKFADAYLDENII